MMRMVKATEAIEVEFKDGQLKVVGGHHTLGYCLDNWHLKKELGNRQHFSTWNQKGWQLNSDDDTISPAGTRHMVLGWKGHSQLVDRNDRERLQFVQMQSEPTPEGPSLIAALCTKSDAVKAAMTLDTSDSRAFLLRPAPPGQMMIQCYIQRRRRGFLGRLYPTYELYLKDGEQFLLAARRRAYKSLMNSNYKISLDKDLSRHSSSYFGKLKSNFMGTEFMMYDQGINPNKLTAEQKKTNGNQLRQELATVLYKKNVLGSRGARKMKVLVPKVAEHGNRAALRPTKKEDTMIERYRRGSHVKDIQVFVGKNFQEKNFQLCIASKDSDVVVMQFGRVGKDAFTMDFQWPLCGLQAFGIALSSLDDKIAVKE